MAPKSKEQFEEIRNQTKENIKNAALELFGKLGYHSTSISQIAKAAGVSKGLMYSYFESKQDLLYYIIMEAMDLGMKLMDEVIEKTSDPYEQFAQIVEGSFQWVMENLHYWKLLTSLAFQPGILEGMEGEMKTGQERAMAISIEIFSKLGYEHPEEEAWFFGALMDGVMLHYLQLEDQYPVEKMKAYILARYKPQ
ncbi:MAG: TetR/AcrR family transcriptional regulator [Saprospiraceae bacterium]|nr:TetR/AcrR family transcriptional regulator [Lewinella sp.]